MIEILFRVQAHALAFMATNWAFYDRLGPEGRVRSDLALSHVYTLLLGEAAAT